MYSFLTCAFFSRSKCRVWERERRDRLKSCFTALGKALPSYDPSTTLSKIEILQKAAAAIVELQGKNRELLSGAGTTADAKNDEIDKLNEHVKKLTTRNEQLSKLLQTAGIRIPNEVGTVSGFKHTKKWSGKISAEEAKKLAEKLEDAKSNFYGFSYVDFKLVKWKVLSLEYY